MLVPLCGSEVRQEQISVLLGEQEAERGRGVGERGGRGREKEKEAEVKTHFLWHNPSDLHPLTRPHFLQSQPPNNAT